MLIRLLVIVFTFMASGFYAQIMADSIPEYAKKPGAYDADSLLRVLPPRDMVLYPKEMRPGYETFYKGKDFDYTATRPRQSIISRIKEKLDRWLREVFGPVPKNIVEVVAVLIRILAVVVIAVALYFIVHYILRHKGNYIFSKKNNQTHIDVEELSEDIHEIDFSQVISDFEQKRDYRSAVRYRYLFVLKTLADKRLIEWNSEKTNHDYLRELTDQALKREFANLSYIFDYVWYGEFDINLENYQYFKEQFNNFGV